MFSPKGGHTLLSAARTSPHYPGGAQTEHPSEAIVNHFREKNKGGQEAFVKKIGYPR